MNQTVPELIEKLNAHARKLDEIARRLYAHELYGSANALQDESNAVRVLAQETEKELSRVRQELEQFAQELAMLRNKLRAGR